MASFSAFLDVKGQQYPLLAYELSIHQETDSLGRPGSPTLGGTVDCILSSPGSDQPFLHQWMFSPTMQEDGKIILMQDSPRATLKTISFFNAYCIGLQTNFVPGAGGGGSLQLHVRLSPQRIAVGAIVHDNNWPLVSHGAGETFAELPVASPPKGKTKEKDEPSAFSEGLHSVLDVVGMIPVIGEVADAANAAIYVAQGDYANATMSAASMIPLAGNVVGAAKLARRGAKLIVQAREFKQVKRLWKSGADLMEKGVAWAAKAQSGSTGFLGSPRLNRRELQAFKRQAKELGAELVVVRDRKLIKQMDDLGVQAGYQSTSNKLFVRKGATAYEVMHELTHAKHRAQLGRDAYEKLSRLEKETHVYDKLMARSGELTSQEMNHATGYINKIRKDFGFDPLT